MLTDLDRKILAALRENGRASWSSLAKRFAVSRVTIQNHVDSMRARKIIRGYTVLTNVDSAAHRAPEEQAFLLIQFAPQSSVFHLRELLADSPHMQGVWGVAGEWDCFVLVRAPSLREIAQLRERICADLRIQRLETRPVLNDFPNCGVRG